MTFASFSLAWCGITFGGIHWRLSFDRYVPRDRVLFLRVSVLTEWTERMAKTIRTD